MSLVHNIVGSGGNTIDWQTAIVHIYAPAGSTVTAKKGGVTKTLRENAVTGTDSEYFLYVSLADYGTWTLSAVLGAQSTTQSVTVDSNIEYVISIQYRVYLYNRGDECTILTGGWIASAPPCANATTYQYRGAGTLTKNKSDMYYEAVSKSGPYRDYTGAVYTQNTIDLTLFSTIKVVYDVNIIGNNGKFDAFAIRNISDYVESGLAHTTVDTNAENAVVSVDVSNITGSAYIGCCHNVTSAGNSVRLRIHEVYLEA